MLYSVFTFTAGVPVRTPTRKSAAGSIVVTVVNSSKSSVISISPVLVIGELLTSNPVPTVIPIKMITQIQVFINFGTIHL